MNEYNMISKKELQQITKEAQERIFLEQKLESERLAVKRDEELKIKLDQNKKEAEKIFLLACEKIKLSATLGDSYYVVYNLTETDYISSLQYNMNYDNLCGVAKILYDKFIQLEFDIIIKAKEHGCDSESGMPEFTTYHMIVKW